MYTDFMLRFANEAEANATLYEQVPVAFNDEGEPTEWEPRARFRNIDTIGVIYEPAADEDAEPVALPGWHINIRLVVGEEDGAALEPFQVFPANPVRVWA